MIKTKPLVSIIMNCHNGEKYLKQSIKSILSQSYSNWELIFWDNNSTDNSKLIVSNFLDNRIKYFKSENYNKLYESRNLAIKKASGEYISFLDTDDMWDKNKIQKQIDFFKKYQDFEVVYTNYYIYEEAKKKKLIKFKKKLPSGMITKNLLRNYTVGILTLCLKRDIFDVYSFHKNYDIIGDFDFVIRLSEKKKIGYLHNPLAIYRNHESNLSKKKMDIYVKEIQNWIKDNETYLKENNSLKYLNYYLFKLKIKNLFCFF